MSSARRGRRRGRREPMALSEPLQGAPRPRVSELCELAPFAVFCALHLGISECNGFAPQEPAAVARRFQLSLEQLEAYLREHRIARDDLEAAGFDLEGARLDMQVAPPGISRVELARTLFGELRGSSDRLGKAAHPSWSGGAVAPPSAGPARRRKTGR